MGLVGSLHCAGMCGPIVWVMPFQQYNGIKRIAGILLYHLGRITTYALLGVLLHFIRDAFHPQWQQTFSIISGSILVLAGILYFLPQLGVRISLPWTSMVVTGLRKTMHQKSPGWLLPVGALNGLLPCGMVYMALAASVSTQHAGQAAMVMFSFGLGTLPMMIGITMFRSRLQFRFAGLRKWTPVLLVAFGLLFVLRGANLGIPFLSPKVTASASVTEVKMDCCHKNK
jgi:hypothetical protein